MSKNNRFDPRIVCYFSYTDTTTAQLIKQAVPDGEVDIYSHRAEALFGINPHSESLDGTYYAHFREAADGTPAEVKDLPEAFVFDLRIHTPKAYKGTSMAEDAIDRKLGGDNEDMQAIATAIELIATHQAEADPRAPKPYIFLKQSDESARIARLLSDNTGLDVHVFKGPVMFARGKAQGWDWPIKEINDFRPLLEQTDAVSPSPKAKTVELEHVAA
ncbi:MAG: hypothetical protein JKY71_07605 [Alphaproteobacteria bacterium]|nr:hypothetical protein [Alphaproteobacteria bacterium]